jgi:hypothetical protein
MSVELASLGFTVSVVSRSTTTPPSSPTSGQRYIIPTGATGIWASKTNQVAHFVAGWNYYQPVIGAYTFVRDEDANVQWDGVAWSTLTSEARRPAYIADEAISALRVVRASDVGHVVYARHPEAESKYPVGITVNAAASSGLVNVATAGELSDSSWSWTANAAVYLGASGVLTQTPTTGYIVKVATALSATTIAIRINPPIIVAA